jgi:hypothetical protein
MDITAVPPGVIRLRFVTGNDRTSEFIRLQAGVCMPFTPSHVECVSRDGTRWIGQHIDGGMQARPAAYDADTTLHECFVDLPATPAQQEAFDAFVTGKIGEPYDWASIVDFAVPDTNFHLSDHAICSAIMTLALRAAGYFPAPLTVPAHHVSPRDLFLILSTHVTINH